MLFCVVHPDSLEALNYYDKAEDFGRNVKYDSSNFYYEKASEIFKKSNIWRDYIDCQKNIGINYRYLGNYSQAFNHLNDGLDALGFLNENQDSLKAELYNSIGSVYYEKGNYEKAYKYYRDMLEINEKLFGTENAVTAKGFHNVGLIYYRTSDYEKALEYLEKALSIWKSILNDDDPRIGNCYTNLANVYFLKGNYSKSIEYDEKALKIWKDKLGESHPYIAMSYNNLASIYTYYGKYEKALSYFYKAMDIRRDYAGEESPEVAFSYANIGNVFTKMGNFNNAKYFLNKGINIYKKIAPSNPELADAYIYAGKLKREKKDYNSAVAYYDSALSIVWTGYNPEHPDPESLIKMPSAKRLILALVKKGNALAEQGNITSDIIVLKKSLKVYKTATDVIDKLKNGLGREESKLMLTRRSYEVNKNAVDVSLKIYKITTNPEFIDSAFFFAERNKAEILSESIADAHVRKYTGLPDSLLSKENDLRADLTLYETRLEESEKENDSYSFNLNKNQLFNAQSKYDELLRFIEQNFPAYNILKFPEKINTSADIRQLLPPYASLIEYFTGDSSITIFALTNSSVNAVTVNCDSTFFNEVRKFRAALQKLNYINYLSSAYTLYFKLIEPVTKFIKNKKKLYIIPDDILAYLPFEALLTKSYTTPFNRDFSKLNYLIRDYEISYHYSSELLRETLLHKNDSKQTSFAGFAPVFSDDKKDLNKIASVIDTNLINYSSLRSIKIQGKKYSSLPETKTEVESIGDLFKSDNYPTEVFINKAATESELKSDNIYRYKFLHLATHGFINEEHPDLSGLVLYDSNDSTKDDGILYAGEVYNLNLNADLLVLSACESGLGKVVKGEGIYGLTRAFFYAGVDNIVVSLWQVTDKSTSVLMINFYKNILNGMDYSSALRKIKLDMIKGGLYSYPLEWSPFILIGH